MILWLQTTLLALVQGITEFLPISSSAHLIIPALLSPSIVVQRSVLFDASLHGGTLLAVILFFREHLTKLLLSCLPGTSARSKADAHDRHLVMMLCVASLPVLLVGYLLADNISRLHHLPVIATTTFVFGLLLWHAARTAQKRASLYGASRLSRPRRTSGNLNQQELWHSPEIINLKVALGIGIGQVAALVPGVSRAGITITCGLWFGLSPQTASRFSFLLAIPVILAASGYGFFKLIVNDAPLVASTDEWLHALFGAFVSFVFAYATIGFFLRLLDRVGMMPFVIYRLLLGGILLSYWWFFQVGGV